MAQGITPFLMFTGEAEAAMSFYVSLFPGATVASLERYGPGDQCAEGMLKTADIVLNGQALRLFNSPPVHAFTFTPSFSLFVTCEDEAELDRLYAALVEGGQALMPLGDYGFSRKFAWVNDRFGVSWQLNLP
jgi:predicted 3-demethylubiquinone-9 3-methyltransferase (glyoxalase superfamily)